MPGDLIISDAALAPAPKETLVPAASRYVVKQVQALYTDNGAGGAWLPALEVVSDAGIVTGRYVGTSVAAGSDQEVTFHPLGSKGAASVAPSGGTLPSAMLAENQALTSNAVDIALTWPTHNFGTNDSTIFDRTGNLGIDIKQPGLYLAWCQAAPSLVASYDFRDVRLYLSWRQNPSSGFPWNTDAGGLTLSGANLFGVNTNGAAASELADYIEAMGYAWLNIGPGSLGSFTGAIVNGHFHQTTGGNVTTRQRTLLVVQMLSYSADNIQNNMPAVT